MVLPVYVYFLYAWGISSVSVRGARVILVWDDFCGHFGR